MTTAKFLQKIQLSESLYTLWFQPDHKLDFIAGQFTEISLPHSLADERGERRWFSLSSGPEDEKFSITTRHQADASSSFKSRFINLRPTDSIQVADVMGDFVLPKQSNVPIIWIAAGVGIAPFVSMAYSLQSRSRQGSIGLFWTTSYDETLPYKKLFEATTNDIAIYDKTVSLAAKDVTSRVSSETLETGLFYLAGPEKFVELFRKQLLDKGLPASRIVADYFSGY